MARGEPEFMHLADGRAFTVRVTPNAARSSIKADPTGRADLLVTVTKTPEGGKANAAVVVVLAKAIGVAKSRLCLKRGATARIKQFAVASC